MRPVRSTWTLAAAMKASTSDSVIIDLGDDVEGRFAGLGDEAADDDLELTIETTAEIPKIESTNTMETVEMPSPHGSAGASPGGPSVDGGGDADPAATAEINLDDLDLDIDQLAATELASLDDLDGFDDLDDGDIFGETGMPGSLDDLDAVTGTNKQLEADGGTQTSWISKH